jgi:hypothetical protein
MVSAERTERQGQKPKLEGKPQGLRRFLQMPVKAVKSRGNRQQAKRSESNT